MHCLCIMFFHNNSFCNEIVIGNNLGDNFMYKMFRMNWISHECSVSLLMYCKDMSYQGCSNCRSIKVRLHASSMCWNGWSCCWWYVYCCYCCYCHHCQHHLPHHSTYHSTHSSANFSIYHCHQSSLSIHY